MKITMGGNPLTLGGIQVKVGDKAKSFKALGTGLSEFDFSTCFGKPTVLTCFPSIDTGVCAIQTNKFNEKVGKYGNKVNLVIVSNDLPFAQTRYCGANGIENAIVVSDYKDLEFAKNYGMLIEELRLLARAVIIIDKDGIVKYVEISNEVKNELDFEKALKALEECL